MSGYTYTNGDSTVYCIEYLIINYPEFYGSPDSSDSTFKNTHNSKLRNDHSSHSTMKNTYRSRLRNGRSYNRTELRINNITELRSGRLLNRNFIKYEKKKS